MSIGKKFGHHHQLSNQGLHGKTKENNCEEKGILLLATK
jgi:hypothetical protein